MNTKIQVGSRTFFNNYEDFQPTDNDFVQFHEDETTDFWVTVENDEHIFNFRSMEKDEFIKYEYERSLTMPLAVCKFLVPELTSLFNIQVDELPIFEPQLKNISSKHQYMLYIYNCYLENGNFTLTDEQRLHAYEMYKERRKNNK